MADIKLDYSASEINNALGVAKSIEYGTVTIESDGTKSILTKNRTYRKSHDEPKIFLKVRFDNVASSNYKLSVNAIVYNQTNSLYNIALFVPISDANNVVPVPTGTFYVDYLIVG
ncbi:MAG: hypothetical protein ACI4RC_04320 [Oscillospiraceae bacterium]